MNLSNVKVMIQRQTEDHGWWCKFFLRHVMCGKEEDALPGSRQTSGRLSCRCSFSWVAEGPAYEQGGGQSCWKKRKQTDTRYPERAFMRPWLKPCVSTRNEELCPRLPLPPAGGLIGISLHCLCCSQCHFSRALSMALTSQGERDNETRL